MHCRELDLYNNCIGTMENDYNLRPPLKETVSTVSYLKVKKVATNT